MSDQRHNSLTEQERRVRDAVRSVGGVRADAAFRERLKREFVSGTISGAAAVPGRSRKLGFAPWIWVLLPVAAAILLLAIFLPHTSAPVWSIQAVRGEGTIEIDGQILAAGQPERIAEALVGGGHLLLSEDVALDLRLGDRLVLALEAGSDMTLPALANLDEQGLLVAEVHHGEMQIMTGPAFPGTAMHILTVDGRTEITGTIVSVYKDVGYTCVCVLEGTARIGPDETRLAEVAEGRLMVMFEGEDDPIVSEISSDHEAGLLEFEERYKDLFEPSR